MSTLPLPSGIVTFLFTDIEGSTQLFQKFPDAMPRALAQHNAILSRAIASQHGHVFQIIGDAFCASFENPGDALNAMLDAQRGLFHQDWGEIGTLRVRMGLHTGPAEVRGEEYVSYLTLARTQRFMTAGHGGQMLLSPAAADAVRDILPEGTTLRDLGAQRLRGLAQPERVYQLVASDLPAEFPPLRSVEAADAQGPATVLQHLVRGHLVGRSSEFALLEQHWNSAQQARAHLVTLSGEPGIGKTRLANELISRAQQQGGVILRGGCYEYEAATPYLPFVEAIRDWVRWQSPENLRASLGSTAPEIAKLAPEVETKLGALPPNPPLPPNEERLRLFDNVARLLSTLAAARGLLFFLDDLHWADQGTLNLLHYLLRHLRNDRILFLAAYREIELDRSHPLASALVEWNREHLATRLSLSRLSQQDTAALLATLFGQATISADFAAVLYRETEGNPFFIEEVVKSLIEQGEIYREGEGWGRKEVDELAIPQSVKETIGRRLNRLTESCTEVLRTAAALGKIFPFEELAAVMSVSEDDVLDALDEATAAQLIRAGTDETFAFTHDKIREVLYEELNPIRRRRLHQRIGDKLEQLLLANPNGRVRVQDLAYHFTHSGDLERAILYSCRAAENAVSVFALEEGLTYYEQARHAAEALNDKTKLADVYESLGDTYSLQGRTNSAVDYYERAAALTSDKTRLGSLHAKMGRDHAQVGDARGEQFLELALTELDPATQRNQLTLATIALGRYYHYHAQHRRTVEYLTRALDLAEAGNDPTILTTLYSYLAGANQHLLRINESLAWARKTIAMGERKNFPLAIANGSEFVAEDLMLQGHWQDASHAARMDEEIGERISARDRVTWSHYAYSWIEYGSGSLAAAEQMAAETMQGGDYIGDARVSIMVESLLAQVQADRGNFAQAEATAAHAWQRADSLNHTVIKSLCLQALGYVHLRQSKWDVARTYLDRCLELLVPTDNQWMRLLLGPILAETLSGQGELGEALRAANASIALAQFGGSRHWEGWSLRVKGQILTRQEQPEEAQAALDQSIAILSELGSQLELARALHQRATLRQQLGQTAQAESEFRQAQALFTQCGSPLPMLANL